MSSEARAIRTEEGSEPTTDRRAFWIYMVGFYFVWALRATVLYRIDAAIPSESWRLVYSNAVKFLIWVVPVFVFLRFTRQARPLEFLKISSSPNRRGVWISVSIAALYLFGVVLVESAIRGKTPGALVSVSVTKLLSIVVAVAISPLLEEIMFRGFVMGKLSEWNRFWRANLVSAVLFSLAHWPYWLWTRTSWLQFTRDALNIVILGLLFGWVVKKSNSLWPGVAVHIANNVISGLINR